MSMHAGSSVLEPELTVEEKTSTRAGWARRTGIDRFSGLYVWAGLVILFGLWVPDTFLTVSNARIIAGDTAIAAMLAMALILPLAAGVFDLSIAANMGLSVVTVVLLISHGHSVPLAMLAGVTVGLGVGLLNAVIVDRLQVDSFIGTLGMSSVVASATYWVVDGSQIYLVGEPGFQDFAAKQVLGLPLSFFYMLLLALVLWYVLEFTPVGRRVYAVGGNPQAARLAGVSVRKVVFLSMLLTGLLAGIVGTILASKLGTANTSVGPSYLLPAFSAVFLGATQVLPGRFNVPGTLVAIIMLSTGVKGLQLAGAPLYVNDLFNGGALIIAVALAARSTRKQT